MPKGLDGKFPLKGTSSLEKQKGLLEETIASLRTLLEQAEARLQKPDAGSKQTGEVVREDGMNFLKLFDVPSIPPDQAAIIQLKYKIAESERKLDDLKTRMGINMPRE